MRKNKLFVFLGTIIALILITFGPTQAARLVPGSVPKTKPLQPLPIGVAPNLNKNMINNPSQVSPSSSPLPENNNTGPHSPELNSPQSAPGQNTSSSTVPKPNDKINPLTVIFLIVFGGLGLAAYFLTNQKPRQ